MFNVPVAMENYQIVRHIGEGSYGKVSLARMPDGKECVLKVVDTRKMGRKEKKSAMQEVKLLQKLKHPYIIQYIDSFLDREKLVIAMPFAAKGDLYSCIKARRGRQFPSSQVMEWFTQATLALKYLHDLHILHRDLKSKNFFVTADNRLKVGDFGISRVLDGTCAFAKTMIGTPYYMAPEVCSERPYSWASDIWALGCVLFELFQLRVPFDASSLKALVQKITRGGIPRATNAGLAEQQLCYDMMSRSSKKRPSAQQILEKPIIQEEIRLMLQQHRTVPLPQCDKIAAEQSPDAAVKPSAQSGLNRAPSARAALERVDQPNIPCSAKPPCPQARADAPRVPQVPLLDARARAASPMHRVPSVGYVPMSPRGGVPQYRAPSPRVGRQRSASPGRYQYPGGAGGAGGAYQYPGGAYHPGGQPSPRVRHGSPSPRRPMYHCKDPTDWYQKALGVLK